MQVSIMDNSFIEYAKDFHVNPEKCENPTHYENYILQNAISDASIGMGVTHVFYNSDDDKEIQGFVTLKASALTFEESGYPALEISELAVNEKYEGTGVGRIMINYVITIANDLKASTLGIKHILVCADPKAVGFYKHLKFLELPEYKKIPREDWNESCTPMYLTIAF